jgi:hypothetical protein
VADQALRFNCGRFPPHRNSPTTRGHCINLPEAPIAQKGFFAAEFFTVKDQENRETFMPESDKSAPAVGSELNIGGCLDSGAHSGPGRKDATQRLKPDVFSINLRPDSQPK